MSSVKLSADFRVKYRHLLLADSDFDTPARTDVVFGANIFPYVVRASTKHFSGVKSIS